MQVLVLSSATGEGHNMAGRAVCERLRADGHTADFLDIFSLAGDGTARTVANAYIGMVKHAPKGFGLLYSAGDKVRSDKRKSPVYFANHYMAKYLQEYLATHPYDAIVATHLFPAETLTYMKRQGTLSIPTVAIATDYACIPFWEETECDYYILPHPDLVKEFHRHGIPLQKCKPLGIPVSGEFSRPLEKAEARRRCGLHPDKTAFLLMCGSMGFGNVILFARALAKRCGDAEIVIICGKNDTLRQGLAYTFSGDTRVHIVGFTDRVADYMAACDVLFTKPGGLSSTEAAVRQIPMVHTSPIPGCERANRRFFSERGMSVTADKMTDQIRLARARAASKTTRQQKNAAQRTLPHDAAGEISRFLEMIS